MRVISSSLLALSLTACLSPGADEPQPPVPTPPAPTATTAVPGRVGGRPVQDTTTTSCDYTEAHDATNDYLGGAGYVLEDTGLVFAGATMSICGQIDNGHFNLANYSIDIDNYGFSLEDDADVIVTLTGDAQYISTVGTWAYDPNSGKVWGGYFNYDHGVFSAHLPAGHYEISVEAYDNADIAAPVPYRLTIAGDSPATRCGALSAPSDYIEAGDGPDSLGNNVFDVDFDANPERMFTSSTADMPEVVDTSLDSGTAIRIDGEAALVAPIGSYLDHDTYLITTGPTTNQLSIRLDWNGYAADLDYYISTAGSTFPIASAATEQMGGGEFATFAVAPSTRYWLWVGSYESSYASTYYDATVCADTFVVQ